MASGPPDSTNQEPAEVQEEGSGKKKSKFQTFKKFFTRKKRKEPSTPGAEAGLKASQSSDNVSKTSENNTLTRSEKDKGSGSKISLGSKALSHDSVFVSDSSEANEALGASQDSIHGKVKSLQLQLKQAIKLGSPPSLMCVKKTEDGGTMSEDDGLPCSPPECSTPHTVVNRDQMKSSNSLIDSDDDQLSCAASSRAVSPLVVPGDFSQPASPFGCLDNSAAKHKLGLRQKACNRRKPATRLEWKTEGDSAVEEMLTSSVPEAETEALEEQKQQKTEDGDQLKPKLEREEEEDEEDEEREQLQDSTISLLGDKEKGEEGEDESEAEQDVSHGPDASCAPELSLSEEEGSDDQPLPSSSPSSRASPVGSPRATPEPSAGPGEHLMDPPGTPYKADDNLVESDSASVEEDMVQENKEEESSLLEEVLSSLKTPLASCSLDVETEDIVLEMKEDMGEKEEEAVETEECVEMKGEEPEVDKSVHRAASSCSVQTDQTSEDEGETVSPSVQEEEVNAIEEEGSREEEGEDKEEDLVMEQLTQDSSLLLQNEEEEQDEKPEKVKSEDENNMFARQSLSQDREEGEEEAIELEEEPEVEEEGLEKTEEEEDYDDDDGEVEVQVNEVMEVEEAEEMTEILPGSQDEEIHSPSPLQEADEAVVLEADTFNNTNDEISTELHDQAGWQEKQENVNQSSEDEREDGEEEAIEDDFTQKTLEEEKKDEEMEEENQLHIDKTGQDLEHESDEMMLHLDMAQVQKYPSEAAEQVTVSSKPPLLRLSDSLFTHSQESAVSPSSKTTVMHINLASPTSEKDASLFQLSPAAADHSKSVNELPSSDVDPSFSAKRKEASLDQERVDVVENVEEEQLDPRSKIQEESSPANVEEVVTQSPDQSKVRFTIAPAWQRSQNVASPPSPPACISSPKEQEDRATTIKDQDVKPEPVSATKAELVLSPGRVMNAESATAKPQSNTTPAPPKPPSSAPANTAESSVKVEENPDNPFGVRLRKTSALLRFSSEEENQEPPVESPTPLASCVVDTLQPVSSKPAICQPFSNKPALPKKPEVHGDAGGKPRRISDPVGGRGISGASDPPNWISVAKQKQKIYKENSLDEINVKKDEQDRKSSLPTYVSSAASRELSNKTAESTSNVAQLEISKPSVSVGKEPRRTLSPPTPVPPQPSKSQPLPCPVAPKPQVPPATSKPPPPTSPPQRSLSPPTPVPVPPKSLHCSNPSDLSKTTTSPKTPPATPPPLSSRPCPPEKGVSRAPGLSGQAVSPQRSLSPPALSQDEPPWMALAKKKAKAWSEMPQIVQ